MKKILCASITLVLLCGASLSWACDAHDKAESQPVKAGQKNQGK